MVLDAFDDLVFTPDQSRQPDSLLALGNDENESAQLGRANSLLPSPSDIIPMPRLNTLRRPATLPSPGTPTGMPRAPLARSSPLNFPLQSPLPLLTPLADLPSPQNWSMISPSENPTGLFAEKPQAQQQDQEKIEIPSAAVEAVEEKVQDPKEIRQEGRFVAAEPLSQPVENLIPSESSKTHSARLGFELDPKVLKLQEKAPEVRRRLFDDDNDEIAAQKTHPDNEPQQAHVKFVEQKSLTDGSSGLKARICPPAPIAIPPNPFAKQPIHKIPEQKNNLGTNISPASLAVQRTSHVHEAPQASLQSHGIHHAGKVSNFSQCTEQGNHSSTFVRFKKHLVQPAVEEKKPVMTREASSVLAELNRQRSQVEAQRKLSRAAPFIKQTPKPLKVPGPAERTRCNCRVSQCIKRYCPCFATSNFCGEGCGCRNCENTSTNSSFVGIARKALMERDPNAFVPRIRSTQRQKGRGRQTIRGCNCRKGCEKNYCICKENGLVCGVKCTCSGPHGCQNHDESKLKDVQQVIENMPPSDCFLPIQHDSRASKLLVQAQATKWEGQNQFESDTKTENVLSHESSACTARLSTATNPHPTLFSVLPTPTTPSMPYNPFLAGDQENNKRSMMFGEPSDGFKRIRVGDPNGRVLPQLRQASSSNVRKIYSTPREVIGVDNRFTEMHSTCKATSSETPQVDAKEVQMPDSIGAANTAVPEEVIHNPEIVGESRSGQIPRILRYRFGSGRSASSFGFRR